MAPDLQGDTGFDNKPSIESKALRINLNKYVYGTFAEIGAGQEVARHFFRVGGASGTIAKTISAYDKNFSDTIYGEEKDFRYVTETRLDKMLSHEMTLLENRIPKEDHPNKMFFTLQILLPLLILLKNLKVMDGWEFVSKLTLMSRTVKFRYIFVFIKPKLDSNKKHWVLWE